MVGNKSSQNTLRIDDQASGATPLIVKADGKVGIGKAKLYSYSKQWKHNDCYQ